MKTIFFCLILFLFASVQHSNAQDYSAYKDIIKVQGLKYKKHYFSIAGLADVEFVKPVQISYGLSLSGAVRVFAKPKLNKGTSDFNPKIVEREIFIKPSFGYIYRKRYNTSIFSIPKIAYRHTFANGCFTELNIDVGYLYQKLNAPVYERLDNGTFKKVNFGFHNVIVGGTILGGYDFSKKLETPIAVHVGSGLLFRYPNNKSWARKIIVEVGISYIFRREKE